MKKDEVVLVFRPPENPAAQVAGITPFKGLRVQLDELVGWFKGLNVESIELWIEGAWKTENRTEVFLSLEGKTCAKVTLKPIPKNRPAKPDSEKAEIPSASNPLKTNPVVGVLANQDPPPATTPSLPETLVKPVPEKVETVPTTIGATATTPTSSLKIGASSSAITSQDPPQTRSVSLPEKQTTPSAQGVSGLIRRFFRHPRTT